MTSMVPMTVTGAEKLRQELKQLKSEARPKVIAAIAEARAHGDLKENGEYHAAREQQSFIEGRIAEIEGKLSMAHVIDITKVEPNGKVLFGTTVTLTNLDTEETVVYKIVGDDEADLKARKISVNSPVARALIGKSVSEVVEIRSPNGVIEYEIATVEHQE